MAMEVNEDCRAGTSAKATLYFPAKKLKHTTIIIA